MIPRTLHRWTACVAGALVAGCTSVPYLADLGKDATEVVNASVGFSQGVAFEARATRLLQVGIGSSWGEWAGLKEGWLDTWTEERSELGISLLYMHELHREGASFLPSIHTPLYGEPGYSAFPLEVTHQVDRGWLSFGVRVNLLFLGVDLSVEPAELGDLVLGIFGIDLLEDDAWSPPVETLLARLESDDPVTRSRAVAALRHRTGRSMGYVINTAKDERLPEQHRAALYWRDWWEWERSRGAAESVPRE
ncbi:MAG: hypothetical protein AB1486_24595 [Planctomycetota bacterium]